MIKRETAIKSVHNRRVESPETRLILDYSVGDVVQIKADGRKLSGKMGVIIGIRAIQYNESGDFDLAYTVRLSDQKSVEVSAYRLRFLRHGDQVPGSDKGSAGI